MKLIRLVLCTTAACALMTGCGSERRHTVDLPIIIAADGPISAGAGAEDRRDVLNAALPIERKDVCDARVLVPQLRLARLDTGAQSELFLNERKSLEEESVPRILGMRLNMTKKLPPTESLAATTKERIAKLKLEEPAARGNVDVEASLVRLIQAEKARAVIAWGMTSDEANRIGKRAGVPAVGIRDRAGLLDAVARAFCERSSKPADKRAADAGGPIVLAFLGQREPSPRPESLVAGNEPNRAPTAATAAAKEQAARSLDRGLMYAKTSDYENAAKEFTNAITLAPGTPAPYRNRGVIYLREKKYDKALDDMLTAAKLDPNDALTHYNLAALYSRRNQNDRGIDSLDKALKLGFASKDSREIDLLKPGRTGDPDLANLRKIPDYCRTLEKNQKFVCK
jgi:tetratricopeptide (TPR) repeat protein